jgi:iron complex transport system permease protein
MNKTQTGIQQHNSRKLLVIILSLIIVVLLMIIGLTLGSSSLSINEVMHTILGKGTETSRQVVVHIRLPRIMAALMGGLALSVSGSAIQTVIRNPLGSPYTLGLSAAAAFGAALAIVVIGAGTISNLESNPYIITLSAFVFSILCAVLITGFARWKGASPVTLVMAGIILTSLFASATSLMQYISSDTELASIVSWMFGDLGKATWSKIWIQAGLSVPAFIYFFMNSWNYNALNAGDEAAQSLGVRVNRIRLVTVMVASLCAAATVAFYGIIAFVGLVVPHITRWIIGNEEHFVITGSAIIGAGFLLLSDIVSRTIASPVVIPVGIITSFIGAPFFLILLIRRTSKLS